MVAELTRLCSDLRPAVSRPHADIDYLALADGHNRRSKRGR